VNQRSIKREGRRGKRKRKWEAEGGRGRERRRREGEGYHLQLYFLELSPSAHEKLHLR
jgi:hypothetical protein